MNKVSHNFNVVQCFYVTLGVSRLLQNKNMCVTIIVFKCTCLPSTHKVSPFMVHLYHLWSKKWDIHFQVMYYDWEQKIHLPPPVTGQESYRGHIYELPIKQS
jgi:hypothetical protein